ncbi:MAG: hypothetical protein Q4D57_01870 [Clostridia bacterium]|nr:hypothetical protein [Clostridia bacterium]
MSSLHELSIINNEELPFLQYIDLGIKKAECRIATNNVKNFKIGEKLILKGNKEFVLCEITYMHFYKSFEDMISEEKTENIVPFVDSDDKALKIYKSFPGWWRVKTMGCCAIGVRPLESQLSFTVDINN